MDDPSASQTLYEAIGPAVLEQITVPAHNAFIWHYRLNPLRLDDERKARIVLTSRFIMLNNMININIITNHLLEH